MTRHDLIFCSKIVSKLFYDKCDGQVTLLQQKMWFTSRAEIDKTLPLVIGNDWLISMFNQQPCLNKSTVDYELVALREYYSCCHGET